MVENQSVEHTTDRWLPYNVTRTRSGQRMWSDPVVAAANREFTQQHHYPPFAYNPNPRLHPQEIANDRTVAPVAAAVCRDIPLRPLPPTLLTHYKNGGAHLIHQNNINGSSYIGSSRHSNNIISSIHDLDLYEDGPHGYDPYATHSIPRLMKQAPKLLSLDDYNLISLGYKPVMARKLPWITVAGIALTATNVFSGVIPLYGLALTNGGPAWATWSFFVIGLMSVGVALCLSELASAYPTTAGVHHWVYQLGSARMRAYLSWMVGWLTIVSAVTVTASVAFYFSSVLGQLLLSLHKTSLAPATLVMFHLGVLFTWQTINLMPVRPIGYLSTFSGLFIVALTVALISVMLSLIGIESSMAHVPFTAVLNYSGSSSAVYAALSSTLMASFVFCPQDTIIRMAEESRRPEKSLPKLMVGSTISSLLIGFPIVIALNYGITKAIKGLLDENVPGIRIILSTMGDSTGTVFVSFILLAIFFTGLIRLSAATRTVYSFARDGGLPHSVYWNHLHPRRKTPQRISWLVTIACMCCIFPFFWGNTVAFHWISSLGCITANISFAIPMFMRLTREGNLHFIPGKFTLGRFSKPLNIISIIWLSFLSLFLMFPSTLPVTKNNFNYAPIVLVILTFIFAVSWFKARTDFTGGAKDVSRASHRIPSRVLEDVYPRKPPSQLHSSVAPQSTPSFHWPPSDDTVQRFKLPFDKKARGKVSASGQNKVLPEQANRPWPGYSIPLTPLRPGFMPPSSPSSKKQKQAHQGAPFGNLTSTVGSGVKITSRPNPRDKHHRQAPSQTMITVTSVQSHPDSILGIPLTESPEMMYGELPIQVHEPSIPPSPPASETHATSDSIGHECSSVDAPSSSSGLFLTRPFESAVIATNTGAANAGIVPEISIAPPTTNSSTIESDRATPRHQSLPPAHPNIVTVAARPDRRAVHHSSLENRAHSPIQEPHPTAIESDFKLRQGISNIFVSGKNKVTTSMNSNNSQHRRTDKNRVLTPYPSSLINPTEESVISDYVVSTIEDSHYDHQPSSTKTILKVSPPSPPLHPMHPHDGHTKTGGNGGGFDGAKYSIKDIINNTKNSLTALPSISQFPTLDGYPLIKSPSTNDLGVETSEGDGRRPSNTNTIRPPELLPLSRSPTIQATNQVYTQTSSLEDVDLNEQLIEADESYEYEYHHDYPVISSSNNRLQSLSPIITGASINGGLFRLSNRDISAASNLPLTLTPSGSGVGCGVIKSSSLITHSTGPAATPTTVLAPASPGANQQHDQPTKQNAHYSSSYSERHDPIERLLLQQAQQQQQQQQRGNNSIPTSTYDLLDSYTPSTALQLLQRTRTVADWAQEQSRIQEKRAKHYARTRALKELRKQDPTATLSVHSESSDLSSFSEVSSFSTSTVSLSEREKTTSTATASTSRAGPASPPNSSGHHHNRQHFQPRSTPPTSLTLLPNEKLTINTNVPGQDEAKTKTVEKMPPFFPRYLSGNKKVASSDPTMEDTQLDQPTRLEMLIREVDEDEEEEEPGLYVDTDDVMSPSMEVESLGAGVGRL